jgi:hypothetical protein
MPTRWIVLGALKLAVVAAVAYLVLRAYRIV